MIELSQNIEIFLIQLIIFPFLYAETHYRFKYFFSYLKKNEPEIITDIPSRITSGSSIPILVIIKDGDKYPVSIIEISVIEENQVLISKKINTSISVPYQDLIIELPTSNIPCGQHHFDIKVIYRVGNQNKYCFADNHRGTNHKPLPIYISKDPLPRFDNCFFGETHTHTNYTSDQVEFGASLNATKILSKAIGLDFFCATDHSYDLDDYKNNYLLNDPLLRKWAEFQQEVENLNQNDKDLLIIPGEEVTVRNNTGKNVHLLIYNSKKFFPGTGDSGEKWVRNMSELSISQVISDLPDSALAFSAHPSETPPYLQKLLINRGSWQSEDCAEPELHGLQFINGGNNHFLEKGKKLWLDQLLLGNRLTGIAGNDAHGNFSRFRQIGFPFFTMRENYSHLFGKWRTGIYETNKRLDVASILQAFRSGKCFMTNGPALLVEIKETNRIYVMGDDCSSPREGKVKVRSSEEFGALKSVKFLLGDLKKKEESVVFQEILEITSYEYIKEITFNNLPDQGYLRAEVTTRTNYQALSNPIWFSPGEH